MAKPPSFPLEIDTCLTVSIADLKRWGCLVPGFFRHGTVFWERGGERVGSVNYTVCFNIEIGQTFLQFNYSHNGEKVEYRVPLISAPANIGKGLVWFFRCPFTGQRCKKLHLINGRFIHRSAVPKAMYKRQTESKTGRLLSRFFEMYETETAVFKELQKPYFKKEYRGKETRRLARLIRKVEKAERGMSLQKVMAVLR